MGLNESRNSVNFQEERKVCVTIGNEEIKYKYVFRAVGYFPGPYLAKRFYRSTHK